MPQSARGTTRVIMGNYELSAGPHKTLSQSGCEPRITWFRKSRLMLPLTARIFINRHGNSDMSYSDEEPLGQITA